MNNILLVFLGAGVGGVLRYWLSSRVYMLLGKQFPYGTLIVNLSGCFLMGILFVLTLNRIDSFSSQLRVFLLIGLLGGYTTFSSFSIETVNLIENGNWLGGIMNMILSTAGCTIVAWLGVLCGRNL